MSEPERIMDHLFDGGFCQKCGRGRTELVAYGDPKIVIEIGSTGLSCSGHTNESELANLREAWRRDQEKYAKLFA